MPWSGHKLEGADESDGGMEDFFLSGKAGSVEGTVTHRGQSVDESEKWTERRFKFQGRTIAQAEFLRRRPNEAKTTVTTQSIASLYSPMKIATSPGGLKKLILTRLCHFGFGIGSRSGPYLHDGMLGCCSTLLCSRI